MALRMVSLVLMSPDRQLRRELATLSWPEHLDTEARAFFRDNLLAERLGDSRRAQAALERGFVPAKDRVAFLAERPMYLPEPPAALAAELDLEDLVAIFAGAIQELRTADPQLDLVFEFTASS